MTPEQLDSTISIYAAGLDAQLDLLHQLQELAVRQHATSAAADVEPLRALGEDRERVMILLLGVEEQIAPLRQQLAAHLADARTRPGFAPVASLHRVAESLVNEILGADRETMDAVRAADATRRQVAQMLEAGGTTLAAYRRSLAPATAGAVILDERA